MITDDTIRFTRIPLAHGSGALPAVGFGTLIPDPVVTKQAVKMALEVGFRHFDCAERYRNETAIGEAMQEVFKAGAIKREEVFVTTKLWNTNHRPERVRSAFDASRRRLQIDYVDCYVIHTPFAFQPGDEQDPRDEHGQVIYDSGLTLVETWRALENLVDGGQCKSIGLSDITLEKRGDRDGCTDKTCRGTSRIPSVFTRMGVARFLPGQWDSGASICTVGTCHGAQISG